MVRGGRENQHSSKRLPEYSMPVDRCKRYQSSSRSFPGSFAKNAQYICQCF
jgi:hypothetical protein